MTWHIPVLFCEGCEAEHKPGKPCPQCRVPGNRTCARCGWCCECASRTVTVEEVTVTCEHCGGELVRCARGCLHHVRDGREGSIFCDPADPDTKTAEQ